MPTISIIVPVYNVDRYLEKCLDSILDQTFRDFELILVNDGSSDSSGNLCDEYALKDNRIIVVHKENGGLSDARNAGIEIAKGKYIGFVDSDDYIEYDMYETLFNNLYKYDADLSVCTDYICYENTVICKNKENKVYILNTEDAIGMSHIISPGVCNKLFRKEIFDSLRFPVGKLNEDVHVFMDILSNVKKVVFTTEPKYYYIQRKSSITKSTFDERKWHSVEAWYKNLEFVKKNYPKQIKAIEYKYVGSFFHILDQLITLPQYKDLNDYKRVRKSIKRNLPMILSNPYIIFKRKIAVIAYIICPVIYKKIIINQRKIRGMMN